MIPASPIREIPGVDQQVFEQLDRTTVFRSTTSPTGYFISFRFRAPNAATVHVLGDFAFTDEFHASRKVCTNFWPHEWKRGMFRCTVAFPVEQTLYRMEKDERTGIHACTVPLPSGSYGYSFLVDSDPMDLRNATIVADPTFPPFEVPDGPQKTSQVHLPFDPERQDEDRSYERPYEGDQRGKVLVDHYFGWGGMEQPLVVYLPHGYDDSRANPYPVLYLSHGGGGNQADWVSQGAAADILDRLIDEGRTEPMVVVMMNNSVFQWQIEEVCVPNLVQCIMPYVESHYRVSSDPNRRATAGLSMGGFFNTDVLFSHPDVFGYFGIWSGGARDIRRLDRNDDFMKRLPFREYDYSNPALKHPILHIGAGRYDDAFFRFSLDLEDRLAENEVSYTNLFPNGSHQWCVWRRLLDDFVGRVLWK